MIPQLVHALSVDVIFPKVVRYLIPAIEHERCSEWTPDAIYQELLAGRQLLFVDDMHDPKNALVARFATWGGERVLYLAFCGGEGNADWRQAMRHIKQFAARYGVSRVTGHFRDGWSKHFKMRKLVTLYEIEE